MTYVKVDDHFPEHPKVLDVGPLAECLWLRGLCYAGRNQTDGRVPTAFVKRMHDMDGIEAAKALVSVGLWEETSSGWEIHDYPDWQRTKAEISDISAKRAVAGKKGGKQKASNLLDARQDLLQHVASKTYPDTDTESDTKTEKNTLTGVKDDVSSSKKKTPTKPDGSLQPYGLFEAFCDELGQDAAAISGMAKMKQLNAAKRLIKEGVTEQDIRRITRWLNAQDWITGGIDLFLVEKQLGKWQMNGKPDSVKARKNGGAPTSTVGRSLANTQRVLDHIDRMNGRHDPSSVIDVSGVEKR
jgi:hypothetical protein